MFACALVGALLMSATILLGIADIVLGFAGLVLGLVMAVVFARGALSVNDRRHLLLALRGKHAMLALHGKHARL